MALTLTQMENINPKYRLSPDEKKARLENALANLNERTQPTPPDEIRDTIEELNPKKILVVCFAGVYRSNLIREILDAWGYEVRNTGVTSKDDVTSDIFHPDFTIYMTARVKEDFEKAKGAKIENSLIFGLSETNKLRDEDLKEELKNETKDKLMEYGFKDLNENKS